MFYGSGCVALLFMNFVKHVEAFGVDVAAENPPDCKI